MYCLFGIQFAVKTVRIIQVYRNRFVAVKILIGSLLLFWLDLKKKKRKPKTNSPPRKKPTHTNNTSSISSLYRSSYRLISSLYRWISVTSLMIWKYLWLIPAQKQFYWKFTCYMKGYFLLWSEFWIYRENVSPLFWVLEVKDGQLLSFYPLWLMSHWFSTWEATLVVRPFCPPLIIKLVAVRLVTLLKHFLDCCMSVFTWPKKFPQRNLPKRSGDSVSNRRALEKLTV